jgi:cyclopropane-fatty-acyl-phospholipid synthase
MTMSADAAARVHDLFDRLLGAPLPLRLRAWDGSEAGPPGRPTVVIGDRRALRRLLWQPNELGLARAYVAGELDVDGDLYEALAQLFGVIRAPRTGRGGPTWRSRAAMLRGLAALGGLGAEPQPPPEEVALHGRKHSLSRDRQAVSHHYDVGNDFYRIVLGPSMVYSCAYWTADRPGYDLADAQRDKLDLICRKLAVRPGMRLLDVGCGWGSLALHAASRYGAQVVGVTLSAQQATYARKQVAEAGLTDRIDIRVQDYREVDDGPYDVIASVGMAEHVGLDQYRRYAEKMYGLLRPGGRLLNHQIAQLRPDPAPSGRTPTFIEAYVFPDGELKPVGTTVSLLEEAGFEVRHVEALREHYGRTLRCWVANLESRWDEAVRLSGLGRARVWRLYMTACALAFEAGHIGVNQVLAIRTHPDGSAAADHPAVADAAGGAASGADPGDPGRYRDPRGGVTAGP